MIADECGAAESETAEANRPGYEGAAHENRSDILAEGGGFVFGEFSFRLQTHLRIHFVIESTMNCGQQPNAPDC